MYREKKYTIEELATHRITKLPVGKVEIRQKQKKPANPIIAKAAEYVFVLFKEKFDERFVYHNYTHTRQTVLTCEEFIKHYKINRQLAEQVLLAASAPPPLAGIVGPHGEYEVAIYPTTQGADGAGVAAALEQQLAKADLPVTYHAAIGRTERGVEGAGASYRQARRTLEYARTCGQSASVLRYERYLPSLLLAEHSEYAVELWRTTVAPLAAHDRRRGTDLVATLRMLFAVVGNRAEAAKRLHVHRHTLAGRLRRIEELTGCSLDDVDDLLRLELGLRAQQVLDGGEPHD
jgi:hypothetical protein